MWKQWSRSFTLALSTGVLFLAVKRTWVLALTVALLGSSCTPQTHTSLLNKEQVGTLPTEASISKETEIATATKLQVTYARLPLHFEPNQGRDRGARLQHTVSTWTEYCSLAG